FTTTRAPDVRCKNADMFGLIEIGCWGYRMCVNGDYVEYLCPEKQRNIFCSQFDNCKSYCRCYGGQDVGQFYCAGSLVFNEAIQTCDFLTNVLPPCGNKRPDNTTASPIIG
ncbi:unnamed protein product, partial [Candidula unifasciata]